MNKDNLILSIESAIEGGSVSLIGEKRLIDFWVGEKTISRSEDLLAQISFLLEKNDLEKKLIGTVAVGTMIGSQTGLRIGFSTALGLKRSLGCEFREFNILSAVNRRLNSANDCLTAIFQNEKTVYTFNSEYEVEILTVENTLNLWDSKNVKTIFVNNKFDVYLKTLQFSHTFEKKIVVLNKNLSSYFTP